MVLLQDDAPLCTCARLCGCFPAICACSTTTTPTRTRAGPLRNCRCFAAQVPFCIVLSKRLSKRARESEPLNYNVATNVCVCLKKVFTNARIRTIEPTTATNPQGAWEVPDVGQQHQPDAAQGQKFRLPQPYEEALKAAAAGRGLAALRAKVQQHRLIPCTRSALIVTTTNRVPS